MKRLVIFLLFFIFISESITTSASSTKHDKKTTLLQKEYSMRRICSVIGFVQGIIVGAFRARNFEEDLVRRNIALRNPAYHYITIIVSGTTGWVHGYIFGYIFEDSKITDDSD